jgi:hypothetical protein
VRFRYVLLLSCLTGCSGGRPDLSTTFDAGQDAAIRDDSGPSPAPDGGSGDGDHVGDGDSGGDGDAAGDGDGPLPDGGWDPPFPIDDEVGWMGSDVPLCDTKEDGNVHGLGVFADERGLFALVSVSNNNLAGDFGTNGYTVHFNDGSGWQEYFHRGYGLEDFPESPGGLAGFPGGDLLLTHGPCLIERVDEQGSECASVEGDDDLSSGRLFSVNGSLVYLLANDRVLRSTGNDFEEVFTLPNAGIEGDWYPSGLWADTDRVVVTGTDQSVYVYSEEDGLQKQAGVPAGNYGPVWSFATDDVWVANDTYNLVHYDGEDWSLVQTGLEDCLGGGITALWGASDGTLYFAATTAFGRVTGGDVEILASWACEQSTELRLNHLTGSAERSEVYVSVIDTRYEQSDCGAGFVLWFDGETLRRF